MAKKWSKWLPIANWLDSGWNDPRVPAKEGVYKVRVKPGYPKLGEKIVYVGRSESISMRIGTFITACMDFDTFHAGGNHFIEQSISRGKLPPVHNLSVRDRGPFCARSRPLPGAFRQVFLGWVLMGRVAPQRHRSDSAHFSAFSDEKAVFIQDKIARLWASKVGFKMITQ